MKRFCFFSLTLTLLAVCWLAGCEQPQAKIKPKSIDAAQLNQTNNSVKPAAPAADPSAPHAFTQEPQAPERPREPTDTAKSSKVDEEKLKQYSIDDIPEVIRTGDLETAAILIERFLEQEPNNPKLHGARQLLASTYSRMRNRDAAKALNDKLLEYFFENADGNLENLEMFPTTVIFVNSMYTQLGKHDERKKIVDDAFEILKKNQEKYIDSLRLTVGVNQLLGIKLRDLVNGGQKEEAIKLAESEMARAKTFSEKYADNDMAVYSYACAIRNAFLNLPFDLENNQSRRSIYEGLVTKLVDKNIDSALFAQDYYQAVQGKLSLAIRDNPELAQEIYDEVLARLGRIASVQPTNRSISKNIDFIKRTKDRINHSLKLKSLVGTPAASLSAKQWIHGDEQSLNEFKGKTTLLFFCAAWSLPSINAIPMIDRLAEKHKTGGLHVAGVTRPYGYYWDDTANKARKSQTDVPVESEIEMVEKFVSEKKIQFPVAMTNQATFDAFGATSVPHFVLIDKKGVIRRIDVGLDPKMLEALDVKIAEIIAE